MVVRDVEGEVRDENRQERMTFYFSIQGWTIQIVTILYYSQSSEHVYEINIKSCTHKLIVKKRNQNQ